MISSMTHRSVWAVLGLTIVTFGFYSIYWLVVTKNELNLGIQSEHKVPTAWLVIVPFANLYWYWKYCKAAEIRCGIEAMASFLIFLFAGFVGMLYLQYKFNQAAPPAVMAQARVV